MKIDKKLIKELTDYLNEFSLTEIEYSEKDFKIKVSKASSLISSGEKTPRVEVSAGKNKIEKEVASGNKVTSPIIGTAYLAPEPGGKKFIEIGKKVKKGDTLMIVEAMKTMNHVPSPYDGVVKEICVSDGQPVEFDQVIVILN
jgi:acetyl-CoA carboxylase biotin carboxyl carrier protein